MQKYSRVITFFWLVISQLGGGYLGLIPVISLILVNGLIMGGGGVIPILVISSCAAVVIPLGFAFASWIAFLRKKDKAAAILSGIFFLINMGFLVALGIYLQQY